MDSAIIVCPLVKCDNGGLLANTRRYPSNPGRIHGHRHLGHIVAVDSVSPSVFVVSEGGELIKWFDCSSCMREPSDIAVHGDEYFICDFKVDALSLSLYPCT